MIEKRVTWRQERTTAACLIFWSMIGIERLSSPAESRPRGELPGHIAPNGQGASGARDRGRVVLKLQRDKM